MIRGARPVLILLACVAAGCDERLADVAGPTPNLAPTFSSIQREIIRRWIEIGAPRN